MRVLILGITGMLGSAVWRRFSESSSFETFGTLRTKVKSPYYEGKSQDNIITGVNVLDDDALVEVMCKTSPDVVINCIGLIKQHSVVNAPLVALPINAMLPHKLAKLCELSGTRLVHISTDCVFSGEKGGYSEKDPSDAYDLYGKSKYIGELHDFDHAVTLRTSIIGHELNSSHSLLNWFLGQEGSIKGYTQAIFSGLPTMELARVIRDVVLPHTNLSGLYHVASPAISKFDLLKLIADIYNKDVTIIPDDKVQIDRSLNAEKFFSATGYRSPDWPKLINDMYSTK